ncbi:MAG: hypothetical protein ACI4B6_03870 [Atopobiaceae bacterium]
MGNGRLHWQAQPLMGDLELSDFVRSVVLVLVAALALYELISNVFGRINAESIWNRSQHGKSRLVGAVVAIILIALVLNALGL